MPLRCFKGRYYQSMPTPFWVFKHQKTLFICCENDQTDKITEMKSLDCVKECVIFQFLYCFIFSPRHFLNVVCMYYANMRGL